MLSAPARRRRRTAGSMPPRRSPAAGARPARRVWRWCRAGPEPTSARSLPAASPVDGSCLPPFSWPPSGHYGRRYPFVRHIICTDSIKTIRSYTRGRAEWSDSRASRLLAHGVPPGSFCPVEGRVGGVGQFLVGGSVLRVACDAYGDGRRGCDVVPFEGLRLDAATYLLGYPQGLLFREIGEDALVLVAAEAGGAAPLLFVNGADDASDLTHDELAEQVSVGVVYLLEAVYVRHEYAQGPSLVGHRLEAGLQLPVEASLGEEAREVVAVHELVQLFEEGGFDLILVRVLEYGVAHVYAVSVGEELAVPRLLHFLAVERDGLPCFYAPQGIAAWSPVEFGVPRFDLHVTHHDVGREWIAA